MPLTDTAIRRLSPLISRKNSLTAMAFFFLLRQAAPKAGVSNIIFRAVKNSSPSAHTPSFP